MKSSLTRRTNARPFSPIPSIVYAPTLPAGLGWDSANCPIAGKVTESLGSMRSIAQLTVSAESLFDAVSTARSAPANTFYVSGSGLDTNAGTSVAPFQHMFKAIQAANATAGPTRIYVQPGIYPRSFGPNYGGVYPAVDIAILPWPNTGTGGRVNFGTFDFPGTVVRDGTYTNCQTWAVSANTVNRVVDVVEKNRFGNYTELTNVSSAAYCNVTPNSWTMVSGTLYVNRKDQATASQYNTRIYRSASIGFAVNTPINVYLEGVDIEGGTANGCLETTMAAGTTGRYVLAAKNCSFRYGGGVAETGGRSTAVANWQGLCAFFGCDASAGWSDGWNFHNTAANAMQVLTVNCTGADQGRPGSQSNNNWTSHENVIGADIAGWYRDGRGGSLRSINASKTWFSGVLVENDHGDIDLANGSGSMRPTLVRVDDTAQYWFERPRLVAPNGVFHYTTGTSTAGIYLRDAWPVAVPNYGPGTFSTY